eukprot:CAMPEP_0202853780 /NCGR_PEP_ID=MMETSP1389-20130828/90657_1 /ASSEMBLY_ACC=CAM_ASM_000865 /TAXON_ID=302021 /ORGANISM="Rhodomonas sp., Strain CCMP768" /LENGTH=215 /DNA_ID=CAMNT_0049532339 /DNA_START=305 /DNA_END=950 /DNA_ORIENTATION=+
MTVMKEAFANESMAARSTAYTEICQDNKGPAGCDIWGDGSRSPVNDMALREHTTPLAPDDFSGVFLLRSKPTSTMTVMKEAFANESMAARSTAYTEICQDNKGPAGWDKNKDAPRPPFPPFNQETALQKVKAAEAAWNQADPELVSRAYSADSVWRNRDQLFIGREAIQDFLTRKWERETNYRLVKNLWTWHDNRIAVRFTYEYQHAESGQWFRC